MRTLALLIVLTACSASGAESFMFSRDGSNLVTDAVALPSCGVRLDNGTAVLGLHGASDADRAACGWYRAVNTNAAPEGMREASRAWRVVGCEAVASVSWEPVPPPEPSCFQISKYRLLCNLKDIGALGAFAQWLSADAERKLLWDAAVSLDSTNATVAEAAASLPALLGVPASAVSNVLERSRAE